MLQKLYARVVNVMTGWYKQPPKVLGRWRMEEDYNAIGKKADFSTEDHCGCDEMRSRYLYEKERLETLVAEHIKEQDKGNA